MSQDEIVATLRRRILRGLELGVYRVGARLPSVREVARELAVDPRVALAGYQALARDGMVEMRRRSGVYVAAGALPEAPGLSEAWMAGVLAEGVARGVAAPALAGWISRSLGRVRVRGLVVAGSVDQAKGLCRELRDDFGVEAEGATLAELAGGRLGARARNADFLLTTDAMAAPVRALGKDVGRPVVVSTLRPDLVSTEWLSLLRDRAYVIAGDAAFAPLLREYFASVPGGENLQVLVLGADDLSVIPARAPVYITQGARERLADTRVPGRHLPPARTIAGDSAREILALVVRRNWTGRPAAAAER